MRLKIEAMSFLFFVFILCGCSKAPDRSLCDQAKEVIRERIVAVDSFITNDSFEKMFQSCPDIIAKYPIYKMELFILTKQFKQASEFIESLDDKKFGTPYQSKYVYLTLISGLMHDRNKDLKKRDSCFRLLAGNTEAYIRKNPCDYSAILFYFQTQSVIRNNRELLDRLEIVRSSADCGEEFSEFKEFMIKKPPLDGRKYYNLD